MKNKLHVILVVLIGTCAIPFMGPNNSAKNTKQKPWSELIVVSKVVTIAEVPAATEKVSYLSSGGYVSILMRWKNIQFTSPIMERYMYIRTADRGPPTIVFSMVSTANCSAFFILQNSFTRILFTHC